jgi:hypothetical protein
MHGRDKFASLSFSLSLLALAGVADAQQLTGGAAGEYIAKAMTAGPPEVVDDATIVRIVNGAVQPLKKGTNDYTCMVMNIGPMCVARNAMNWVEAWQSHAIPPDKLGFIYMLSGDTGASNSDPWAIKQELGNHWVKTGAHVMVVGPDVKKMAGFPRTLDPDPTKPYVMWMGTPYEHLVLPVIQNSR